MVTSAAGSTQQGDDTGGRRLEVDDVIVVKTRRVRTAISGTVVGNFMEWFDFGIYGYLAVTMTAVFTAGLDEGVGLLVVLFGFAISFLVRPLGGLVLGPLGDRIGRAEEEHRRDADDPLARHGILGIFRYHWRPILIGIALVAATNTAGYALTSYMPTYLEETVGLDSIAAAIVTVPVLLVMSACLPLIGRLSDRIGRRPVYGIAVVSTLVLMVPAFAIMQMGQLWAVVVALCMVAIPVGFYVAISASALPALFPTASRFGAMAIAYNLAVSLFGGTTPLFSEALIQATGNTFMPAFSIMLFAALGGIALLTMPESAKRPLVGSVPTVETRQEAEELVEGQDDNPYLDTASMPLLGAGASRGDAS